MAKFGLENQPDFRGCCCDCSDEAAWAGAIWAAEAPKTAELAKDVEEEGS